MSGEASKEARRADLAYSGAESTGGSTHGALLALGLTDIGGESDDFAVVFVLQPLEDDGGI